MGLCSDLNDVSSDSIPLLLVALFAHCVCYVKSMLFCLLHSVGLWRIGGGGGGVVMADGLGLGSGMAGLSVLAEQLNVHRVFSFSRREGGAAEKCVVCLCGMGEGEQVRRLACCHVFHKDCLDAWFDHQNLSCPLCRAPLAVDERVADLERRVGGDLLAWFSPTHHSI